MSDTFKPILSRLAEGHVLTDDEAEAFFTACLRGEATPAQVAAAVTALRLRGETVPEIAAFVRVMRRHALMLEHDHEVIDTCGTGGDGQHTFNISTAAALVAAGGGLKVAKHGNRALSSKSGSSDVLAALGVNLDAGLQRNLKALDEAGVCFLFAPAHHGAMRHVTPVRAELGFRTIFNLLGPLANPAAAKFQVIGVYDPKWLEPMARVLGALGTRRAWVVHGSGLDEITTTGETQVAEWRDGQVRRFTVTPEEVGLERAPIEALRGGDPEANAQAIRDLLDGQHGPYRDIVLMNAGAAFVVAGKAETLADGIELAREVINSGRAEQALARLVEITNAPLADVDGG
ncbi:MAG TPA: anthranilate phosphoribosyltransferase [Caulobacteraceae bacterium]|nr:anthranilate phosphoribosyltransferase [Caulobacteraceae bacterium]